MLPNADPGRRGLSEGPTPGRAQRWSRQRLPKLGCHLGACQRGFRPLQPGCCDSHRRGQLEAPLSLGEGTGAPRGVRGQVAGAGRLAAAPLSRRGTPCCPGGRCRLSGAAACVEGPARRRGQPDTLADALPREGPCAGPLPHPAHPARPHVPPPGPHETSACRASLPTSPLAYASFTRQLLTGRLGARNGQCLTLCGPRSSGTVNSVAQKSNQRLECEVPEGPGHPRVVASHRPCLPAHPASGRRLETNPRPRAQPLLVPETSVPAPRPSVTPG